MTSYIGQLPATSFDNGLHERFTGLTTNYVTLTHAIATENDIIVWCNNVKQDSTNYSVGGTGNKTLTLGDTLVSGDVVQVHYVSRVMQSVNPNPDSVGSIELKDNSVDSDAYVDGSIDAVHLSANSVDSDAYVDASIDTAHIGATQVTGAKLNTDVISAQTALTAEPADTDEFMVSDAGVLKRIDYSLIKGGGITEFDHWRQSASSTGDLDPISSNWERVDDTNFEHVGTGMSESSGIFSFPSTGKWWIQFIAVWYGGASAYNHIEIQATPDNSTYTKVVETSDGHGRGDNGYSTSTSSYVFDVTNTTNDKVRFKARTQTTSSNGIQGSTSNTRTGVTFMRIGDT